jgi:hypothetical protein
MNTITAALLLEEALKQGSLAFFLMRARLLPW